MTDISGLEQRLSRALGRIGAAAEGMRPRAELMAEIQASIAANTTEPVLGDVVQEVLPQAAAEELDALRLALGEEQASVAQLEARLQDVKSAAESEAKEAQTLRQSLTEMEAANRQLSAALDALTENNKTLRGVITDGAADATMIEPANQVELDALRAQRQAEQAELRAILAALDPDQTSASTQEGGAS